MTTADLNNAAAACEARRFSWQRVWMLAKYMLPTLRKQLIAIPIVSVLCAVLYYSATVYEIDMVGMASLTAVSFMFYLSPIGLARNDNRLMVAQLPLSASEKLAFLLVYFWGVVGMLTLGIAIISLKILGDSEETVVLSLSQIASRAGGDTVLGFLSNIAITLCFQSFVLYGVITANGNRIMRGVVNLLVAYVSLVLVSFIGGIIMALMSINPEQLAAPDYMKEGITYLVIAIGAVAVALVYIVIHKLYKRLKYCGF